MTRHIPLCIGLLCLSLAPAAFPQDAQQPPPAPSPQTAAPLPQAAPPASHPSRIRSGGDVARSQITHLVQPEYPPVAKAGGISGTVVLHAVIARDGTVKQLEYVSGPPLLMKAAMDAVKQWTYKPTLLNGEPVEVDTTISVVFTLADKPPSADAQSSAPSAVPNANAGSQSPSQPAVDPHLRSDILRLLEICHLREQQKDFAAAFFESMKPPAHSSLPVTPNREKILEALKQALIASFDSEDLMNNIAAEYAKYFSDEDVNAMIQFYETPAGQHSLEATPKLAAGLIRIGQKFAHDNLPLINRQLCSEFPELRGVAQFCPAGPSEKKSELLPLLSPRAGAP